MIGFLCDSGIIIDASLIKYFVESYNFFLFSFLKIPTEIWLNRVNTWKSEAVYLQKNSVLQSFKMQEEEEKNQYVPFKNCRCYRFTWKLRFLDMKKERKKIYRIYRISDPDKRFKKVFFSLLCVFSLTQYFGFTYKTKSCFQSKKHKNIF